jgi:hypothetical protein
VIERENETHRGDVGAKKMNREIVGQEQHPLDCDRLMQDPSLKAFLKTKSVRTQTAGYRRYMSFAFCTYFGRGLQAKMEVRNEGKYMKRKEVRI